MKIKREMLILGLIVILIGSYIVHMSNRDASKTSINEDGTKTRQEIDILKNTLEERLDRISNKIDYPKEQTESLLESLLGSDYLKILQNKRTFNYLIKKLDSRTLEEIIAENEFLRKTVNSSFFNNPNLRAKIIGLFFESKYQEIIDLLDQYLEENPKLYQSELSKIYHLKAFSYNLNANYSRAEENFELASAIKNEDPRIHSSYSNLLFFLGKIDKALNQINMAMAKYDMADIDNKSVLCEIYLNYGDIYHAKSDFEKSKGYYLNALSINKEIHFHKHGFRRAYLGLAILYRDKKDFKNSMMYFQKCLDVTSSFYQNSPDLFGMLYTEMGVLFRVFGKNSKALEYFNKALNMISSHEEENKVLLADIYLGKGNTHNRMGQYNDAIGFFRKSNEIIIKKLGPKSSRLALSYSGLGYSHFKNGNYENAIEFGLKSVEIDKLYYGNKHYEISNTLRNIAIAMLNLKDYVSAEKYLYDGLAIVQLKYPDDNHPDIAYYYGILGNLYHETRKYEKSLKFYKKAYSIFEKHLSSNDPQMLVIKKEIAVIKKMMNN